MSAHRGGAGSWGQPRTDGPSSQPANSPRRPVIPTRRYDTDVVIRRASPDDDLLIARLAVLDGGARKPGWPQLLAESGGEIRAVLSLKDRSSVSDPFWPSAALLALLAQRAAQLALADQRRPTLRGRLRRLTPQIRQ